MIGRGQFITPLKFASSMLIAALLLGLYAPVLLPQSQMTTGIIEGTVYDEQGAVVPGARVEFKHLGIGIFRRVRSDNTGRYIAILLPIGNYEVTARQDGFAATKRIGIRLTIGQTQRVDLPLTVAPSETTIEVRDAGPFLEFRSEQSTSRQDGCTSDDRALRFNLTAA